MFKSLKCKMKGHLFLDSRSEPGVKVCARCRLRRPFEGLASGPEPSHRGAKPTADAPV